MPAAPKQFLAAAGCAVVLLLACNDHRVTGPDRTIVHPLLPRPLGNTTNPRNSPDFPVGQFGPRDTTNAGTATGAGFGFRVKWLTRYKVSVSDWADQVANGYPLTELHPVPLSGTIVVRSGTNADRSVGYSHAQAGPSVTYLQLNANDTVLGVTRAGYAAGNRSGMMADSTPFWCGPSYPAHPPCYYYYGTPGSATLERLNAEVELTADSTSAGYGSNVTFVLQAVPAYVEGQPMAISIDSTAWIADEDSLGGDWNDATLTGACTWDNTNYWVTRQCTRAIRSSGTLRVRGGINGKYFEKTWQVSRTDAYPIVTAKRYFVSAGQRDTFTVRMSDGSPFSSLRWTWAADSGTAQSQIVCALYANPCNGSIIQESGRMRARVAHNGVFKYSQAHVTVGPRPRLQLSADRSSVVFGETVNFSTSAGAAPYSITSWKYHRSPAAACGTNRSCAYAPGHSGRMRVDGVVDGQPDSAFLDVAVRLNPDGTGLGGAVVDSNALDSAGAASLTVIATAGIDVEPARGGHVFPEDSIVPYAFVLQPDHMQLVVLKDDTGSTATGTLSMTRSHVLEGAARPDYLLNTDVADIHNRLRQLLTETDKKLAYASLLTRYAGMSARTSTSYADWVFMVADRLAYEVAGADSASLRALDDTLGGTFFHATRCGDSLVFRPNAEPTCGLVGLRRSGSSVASTSADSGMSHVIYVNGMNNTRDSAVSTFRALREIVEATSFSTRAKPYLFYNPTFREQQKAWNERDRACAATVRSRFAIYYNPVLALSDMADCLGEMLVRQIIEQDLFEATLQRLEIEYGFFTVTPEVVDALAGHLPPLMNGGRSFVFVAHSQGNLIVDQALRRVQSGGVSLIDKPSHCVALLSLATPLNPSSFILPAAYRRHFSVRHDILTTLGMDFGEPDVEQLVTPLSLQADTVLAELAGHDGYLRASREWGVAVHNARANYFAPPASVLAMKTALEALRMKCYQP